MRHQPPASESTLKVILNYLAWPVALGALLALLVLQYPNITGKSSNDTSSLNSGGLLSFPDFPSDKSNSTGAVSYSSAVKRAAPSVVNIYTRKELRRRHPLVDDPLFRHFFKRSNPQQQNRLQSALGSGVIANKDGYILTNNHVIQDAADILVLLVDGREAPATVVGSDPDSDLAVLKIELTGLQPIPLQTASTAEVGDIALAIGNPLGVGQTVTQGIVSATGRYGLGLNTYENFIQTDAAINPGNSGGALIDAYGNLLGINTAVLDKGYSGIGFAIPADTALDTLNDIIEHGKVVRGWLGITAAPMPEHMLNDLKVNLNNAFWVTDVAPNSPAANSGLREGDIITHINQRTLAGGRRTMFTIADTEPGKALSMTILRQGEQLTLETVVGIKPEES